MENNKPSNDTACPMCRKIPEDLGLKDHEYFVWNKILNRYICEFCNLELVVEFYQMDSKYFEMASRMVNQDVWEIRKRYLEDVLEASISNLSQVEDLSESEFHTDRVERCKLQIHAIDRFLELKSRGNNEKIEVEFLKLQEALSIPAFDVDFILPNLISVGIP